MLRTTSLAFALLLLWGSGIALAQNYKELNVDPALDPDKPETRNAHNLRRMQVQEMARAPQLDDNNRQAIRTFLRSAYFPTWSRKANIPELANRRAEFLRTFYPLGGGSAEARALINEEAKNVMSVYIGPDYHPVLRYNAMLLLGELRASDHAPGTNQPEVPYAPSNAIILSALEDPDQTDAVKVAALVGLHRRCLLYGSSLSGMDNNEKRKLLTITVNLLEADEAPEDRDEEVHLWMRRRAMDIVAALQIAGPQGVFAKALDKIIDNEDLPIPVRCEAIVIKGNVNYDQATRDSLDIPTLSVRMARVAQNAIDKDIEWFDKALAQHEKTKMMGGRGAYGMMDGYSPPPSGLREASTPRTTGREATTPRGRDTGRGRNTRGSGESRDPYGAEYGYEGQTAEPERDEYLVRLENTFRRRVKFHIDAAKSGLVGSTLRLPEPEEVDQGLIRYAKNAEDRQAIYDLADSMIKLLAQLDDADTQEKELLTKVRARFNTIRNNTVALAGAKAEALLEEEDALEEADSALPGGIPGPPGPPQPGPPGPPQPGPPQPGPPGPPQPAGPPMDQPPVDEDAEDADAPAPGPPGPPGPPIPQPAGPIDEDPDDLPPLDSEPEDF